MDDGPKPMKHLKPAKKTLNSADQFWLTHQSRYEGRSKTSEDRIDRVRRHNSAYPKMRDAEDKRRSMVQVKTSQANKNYKFDPKCEACMKLKQLAKIQKLKVKPKCQSKTKKKYQKERESRVKKRTRFQRSKRKTSNKRTRNCNFRIQFKDNCTGMDFIPINSELKFDGTKELSKSREKSRAQLGGSTNSVHTLQSPDTSDPSFSSYNSFAFMDHEPMVSTD